MSATFNKQRIEAQAKLCEREHHYAMAAMLYRRLHKHSQEHWFAAKADICEKALTDVVQRKIVLTYKKPTLVVYEK